MKTKRARRIEERERESARAKEMEIERGREVGEREVSWQWLRE